MYRFSSCVAVCLFFALSLTVRAAPLHLTAKYWEWSPDAPHHAAVVMVRAEGRGGTGVIVRAIERRMAILTSHHITEDAPTVHVIPQLGPKTFPGVGTLVGWDAIGDLSLIYCDTKWRAVAVGVATVAPEPGDRLEVCGFGGPGNHGELRHYWATATAEKDMQGGQYARGNALPGDSGGAIFNEDYELVGILSGGSHTQDIGLRDQEVCPGCGKRHNYKAHFPIRASNLACIRSLLQRGRVPMFPRIRQRMIQPRQRIICPPGGSCPPGGGAQLQPGSPQIPEFLPPDYVSPESRPPDEDYVAPLPDGDYAVPPLPDGSLIPDICPPSCPTPPTAAEVAEELKSDAEFVASLKGEPGPSGEAGASGVDGVPGEPGAQGSAGKIQSIDADALAVKIAALLKQDVSFVASVTGPPGEAGDNAKPVDVDVLLADLQARWPPLQVEIMGAGDDKKWNTPDDEPVSIQEVGVGGTITIPPMILEKIDGGKRFYQVKPLGEALRINLVPVN